MELNTKLTEIHALLQKAIELEFATIPPYLTAVFSLKPNSNRSSFTIIHSVYMEEMLHLVLAANILNAIGGQVKLEKDNIPQYPLNLEFKGKPFQQREFEVHLERFCKSSINTFMKIEMPEYIYNKHGLQKEEIEFDVPSLTIGEFYELIKRELIESCERYGEKEVFCGDINKQITEEYYWSGSGKVFEVDSLKKALLAIDVIVEQGEGAGGDSVFDSDKKYFDQENEVAHYFRFNEIFLGQKYRENDHPLKPPTGDKLSIDWEDVYPIKKNCKTSDFENNIKLKLLNHKFNLHFTIMIRGIGEALNGKRETLFSAIMNDMHGMAKIASQMVQIPIDDKIGNETGAPTFEIIEID